MVTFFGRKYKPPRPRLPLNVPHHNRIRLFYSSFDEARVISVGPNCPMHPPLTHCNAAKCLFITTLHVASQSTLRSPVAIFHHPSGYKQFIGRRAARKTLILQQTILDGSLGNVPKQAGMGFLKSNYRQSRVFKYFTPHYFIS
jgi:hypothetical protein